MLKVGSTAFTCDASSVGALWYDNSITNGMKTCVKTATSPVITYGFVAIAGGTNPCAGKTAGQACTGTTAVYVGYPGWMTTPSDAPNAKWSTAVSYCDNLDYGGYTDWVLPGKSILAFVQENKTALGCASSVYWAGKAYDIFRAFLLNFPGAMEGNNDKINIYSVRCVRSY